MKNNGCTWIRASSSECSKTPVRYFYNCKYKRFFLRCAKHDTWLKGLVVRKADLSELTEQQYNAMRLSDD